MSNTLAREEFDFIFKLGTILTNADGSQDMFVHIKHLGDGMYQVIPIPQTVQTLIEGIPSEYRGKVSDGYHTFDELYDHRCLNFLVVCRAMLWDEYCTVWRSRKHSDGSEWDGWFIMGIGKEKGEQITYHLPMKYWELAKFAPEYDTAPPFDGHTSPDVLVRLETLLKELG